MSVTLITHGELETIAAGKSFAAKLVRGSVVAFFGDLGAGKTRFIKGICDGLGVHKNVSSPTFTIVHEYPVDKTIIYHFDFYRIRSRQEIIDLGFDDYFREDSICLIEWAEKAAGLLPPKRFEVYFTLGTVHDTREIRIIEDRVQEPA